MDVKFRQGSETLSDRLIARAQLQLARLSRLIDERQQEALVYVDVERESGSQNSESLWRASVNLDSVGNRFNAVETGSTPEMATDLAIKDLKRELRRAKARQQSLVKRGASLLKRLRQGFR